MFFLRDYYSNDMGYQGLSELSTEGFKITKDHWTLYIFYSSHVEESVAMTAREAQDKILPLLRECDPGFAFGVTVEMHAGDVFDASQAPEERRAYFVTAEDGSLKMVQRSDIYSYAISAYNVRMGSGRT